MVRHCRVFLLIFKPRVDFRFAHVFPSASDITGQMPSVTHLNEVQMCLSRIQQILVQLQKFWEKVGSLGWTR